jgi:hypothetical protein
MLEDQAITYLGVLAPPEKLSKACCTEISSCTRLEGEGVGVGVGLREPGVALTVGVTEGVASGVELTLGVKDGVTEGVASGVELTLGVTDGVIVAVGVTDGVASGVTPGVELTLGVTVGVGVGEGSNP